VLWLMLLAAVAPLAAQQRILYAAEASRLPLGTRVMAMGDVGVALPLTMACSWWNPATACFVDSAEVWAEGARLYEGLSEQGALIAGMPVQQTLAVAAIYTPFFPGAMQRNDTLQGSYTERLYDESLRADGKSSEWMTFNTHQIGLSLAKRYRLEFPRAAAVSFPLPVDIGFGLTARYLWHTVRLDSTVRMGMNLNLDIGMLLQIGVDYDLRAKAVSRRVCLAAAVRNAVPSEVVWVNSPYGYREPVDNTQLLGLSYIDEAGIGWLQWTVGLALHRNRGETLSPQGEPMLRWVTTRHLGVELGFFDIVDIRAGISDKVVTLGAGVAYQRYRLDYAFRFDRIANSALRLGAGVLF
jgi:hypothetical protein